jgi:hypothetical protein
MDTKTVELGEHRIKAALRAKRDEKIKWMAIVIGALVIIPSLLVAAIRNNNDNKQLPTAPAHEVVTTRDLSFGAVRRLQARVSLPQHYTRDEVESVAQAVVANITGSQQVNAISILFYGPQNSTSGFYDVASVDWAPNGRWGDAVSVRAGDYSTFRYSVSYNPPGPPAPSGAARLAASGRTGLLGVPLPEGAKLIEVTAGDPATGRDPSESYAVSASAAEIMAFFIEAMLKAGWAKDGVSRPTVTIFRKGNFMIGVFTKSDGGTFTLMGS